MESTARDRTTGPAPAVGRPRLEVVAGIEAPAAPAPGRTGSPSAEPEVWRNAGVGGVAGFLFAALAVTAAGVAGGMGAGGALALGTFVGLWGGVGFGFMMGATVPLARQLDATHARRPTGHGHGASG